MSWLNKVKGWLAGKPKPIACERCGHTGEVSMREVLDKVSFEKGTDGVSATIRPMYKISRHYQCRHCGHKWTQTRHTRYKP